ncbi:MAG TPA: hypothetical protein ENJ32_06645 [Crenotrichaceae bacterium]|nr:hypothetical protein [Crenotrichaceae bacterium]
MHVRFILLLVALLIAFHANAAINNEVAFYIDAYGELTAQQEPKVAEAQRIFKRLQSVADRNSKHLAKLVVINNKTHAWAIALPAGHIILSRQVLDIVHRDANTELAQARLAFVIGHELAHLANDDYWHHEVESFMQNTSDARKIAQFLNQNFEAKQAELAADDKGYIYAAMAGYAVDRLIKKHNNKQPSAAQDFFTFWMQQTNTKTSPSHPEAKDRAELLRQRLNQLKQKLAFFRVGTRLAHFGHCNDAIYFLKEFQKVFPGRAVLNNLGQCYLQQAQSQMQQKQLAFYWLPLSLDTHNRASALTRGGIAALESPRQFLKNFDTKNSTVSGYLDDAIEVLSLAVSKDPYYIPARINLAIAYLYQGKPHRARAILADTQQQSNDNATVTMLDALALYEQTDADIDLWATAIKKLERLEQNTPSMYVLYNHARLLSVRPRLIEAQKLWNRLRDYTDYLPAVTRKEVCSQQNLAPLTSCMRLSTKKATKPNWSWLFTTSLNPLTNVERERLNANWQSIGFDWAAADLHGFIHQRSDDSIELLELNNTVQIQVLKGDPIADLTQINGYCKYPLIKRTLDADEVWSCDNWAVLVSNQQAREIWYIQK